VLLTLTSSDIPSKNLEEDGGELESLSKILGHTSIATTIDLYGTKSLADLQEDYYRVMRTQNGD
jgi:hypothetical protein